MHQEEIIKETFFARILHKTFVIGIWIKGFDAVLEVIGGFLFLLTSNLALNQLVVTLTEHELIEDPHDKIAIILRQTVAYISSDTWVFGSAYLIGHGLIKLWLVMKLLQGRRWAYPATIMFLCFFIGYQLYHISSQYSLGLILLTVFDTIFALSIFYEYQLRRRKNEPAKSNP